MNTSTLLFAPRRRALVLAMGAAVALGACEHEHEHGEGRGHDPAGAAEERERPRLSVTVYESGLELFMEYDALVVGMESPLVAHFTDARDPEGFVWITKGRVTATLAHADGTEETFVADTLLRNGIFKPLVKPSRAGPATLTLTLEGEQLQGVVHAGDVTVFGTLDAALQAAPAGEPAEPTVGYLKEAQWKTQYATAPASPRVLQGGIPANGEIVPVAGQAAELAAPIAGRVILGDKVPFVGQPVKKGVTLVAIAPTGIAATTDRSTLELEQSRANAELAVAEREAKRAEELLAARAVPEKQLEAARAALDVANARVAASARALAAFHAAQGGAAVAGSTFDLRSPIDGVVAFAHVTRGAVVEAGQRLVSVVNVDKVWLEAKVYEDSVASAAAAPGAVFTVTGIAKEFTVDDTTGRRVAVGAVIDAATRTVPVIFEVPNPTGELRPGMFAKVTLLTGETVHGVAIPEQAIVDDNGEPIVFVMDGGESFFKRRVKLGVRSGGYAQVLDGVRDGERVVSRGAYEVKLATTAGGIPEHGHQH